MERRSLLRIRVSAFKTSPAALSISAQAPLTETLNFHFDLPFHWKVESWIVSQLTVFKNGRAEPDIEPYLNKWIPLPDDQRGGNQILLRRCMGERERPLVMYPRLHALGLEMCFHSSWYGQQTVVKEFDILKPCPQRHIWIFCSWCGKFHLPFDGPSSHRGSRRHQNMQWYMDNQSLDWMRQQCGFMHADGKWL